MGPLPDSIHQLMSSTDNDPIKHVVVLMFENHSFDQMLSCFKETYPQLEGVDLTNLRSNKDSTGKEYWQRQSNDPIVSPDPMHELEHVANQLLGGNSGFVSEYEKEYPETKFDQWQRIMDYFGMGDLPALHELAKHFTICDRWYSSVPGPTWTNRFFVNSGTSLGRVKMPGGWDQNPELYMGYTQDTIFDRIDEGGRSWKVYHGDVPQSLVLSNRQSPEHRACYEWLPQFFQDAQLPERDFPDYSFIEPRYFHIPFGEPQNDDHPPHSTIPAQSLLANVYNALRANDDLWNSTLLIVVYDEHGGFYDHVVPPPADPPDDLVSVYAFNQYGVRVPALLISPWTEQRFISTPFDHTSILKFLIKKWNLRPLTKRVDAAESFEEAITVSGQPRTDTPLKIEMPKVERRAAAAEKVAAKAADEELNENQKALLGFTEYLESKTPAIDRPKLMMARSLGKAQLARERVRAFLEHGQGQEAKP